MKDIYESPFKTRYSGSKMLELFSEKEKFITWRKLWIALAEAEKELGLKITEDQINELKENINDIDFEMADKIEKEVRHDVMAHVRTYGIKCPKAAGIIHLGATSCYVGDNTDIIIMKKALEIIRGKIIAVIANLKNFALKHKDLAALGFTHFQPAQPVTVGKRACLWIQDLIFDLEDLDFLLGSMKLLGSKGTTGTQASFAELFDNDRNKVKKLDQLIAEKMGFSSTYPVTGQTYSRKQDYRILSVLSSIAQSCYKFSNDLRLLQHMKEVEEPFGKNQIGSSAMAYKRNPMRSERISSLSRYVIVNSLNSAITASTQWLERTLDDSANKRIAVSESFLALDGILDLYINVTSSMVVYPKMIRKHLEDELPFMATENILMEAVKKGANRQEIHERIRIHSMEASRNVKENGLKNDLIDRIIKDKSFGLSEKEILNILDPDKFTGFAALQVEDFISDHVEKYLKDNCESKYNADIKV